MCCVWYISIYPNYIYNPMLIDSIYYSIELCELVDVITVVVMGAVWLALTHLQFKYKFVFHLLFTHCKVSGVSTAFK